MSLEMITLSEHTFLVMLFVLLVVAIIFPDHSLQALRYQLNMTQLFAVQSVIPLLFPR